MCLPKVHPGGQASWCRGVGLQCCSGIGCPTRLPHLHHRVSLRVGPHHTFGTPMSVIPRASHNRTERRSRSTSRTCGCSWTPAGASAKQLCRLAAVRQGLFYWLCMCNSSMAERSLQRCIGGLRVCVCVHRACSAHSPITTVWVRSGCSFSSYGRMSRPDCGPVVLMR